MSDLIDRQEALEAIKSSELGMEYEAIEQLPSAQPERKTGRWIHDGCDHPHGVDWMHCSNCGRREPYVPAAMTNYCPACGAKMEVEQDE